MGYGGQKVKCISRAGTALVLDRQLGEFQGGIYGYPHLVPHLLEEILQGVRWRRRGGEVVSSDGDSGTAQVCDRRLGGI